MKTASFTRQSFKPKWDASTSKIKGPSTLAQSNIKKKFPKCDIKLAIAAKSFGLMVRPIEDLDLIHSMLSSPEKKQVTLNNDNMIDNRVSFLANA